MSNRRRVIASVVSSALSLLVFLPVASGAARLVATVDTDTPISAYAGTLVFSQRDTATNRFALVTYRDGVTTRVPIAERAVPFDADLGPAAGGHTAAVYSRCAVEPAVDAGYDGPAYQSGQGCSLYEYDFTTATETNLTRTAAAGASEFRPTIWGNHIAFARVYANKPAYPYLYERTLTDNTPSVGLAIGPRTSCERANGKLSCARSTASTPLAMDLRWPRLAFGWAYQELGAEGLTHQIRLDVIGADSSLVAQAKGGGISEQLVDWPSLAAGSLSYATACFGDPQGCGTPRHHLDLYSYITGQHTTAPGARTILGQARDASTTYLLTAANEGEPLCRAQPGPQPSGCTITATTAGR